MTLKEFDEVCLNKYFVGVKKETAIVDSFTNDNIVAKERYKDCTITSVHIFDEDELIVNIMI